MSKKTNFHMIEINIISNNLRNELCEMLDDIGYNYLYYKKGEYPFDALLISENEDDEQFKELIENKLQGFASYNYN